jgi:hypothetical protein
LNLSPLWGVIPKPGAVQPGEGSPGTNACAVREILR